MMFGIHTCRTALILLAIMTSAAAADVINVQGSGGAIQWPTPNPSFPPPNGTTRGTGGTVAFPLFNNTQGFLTQVDLSFNFASGYGGSIRNFSNSNYTGRISSSNGTNVRFSMAPFGTLWDFNAPPEGSTPDTFARSFGSSFFISGPTPTFSSPVSTFTDPNQLQNFIGIGNTLNLSAGQTYTFNLGVIPARTDVSVGTFQRVFAPRVFATYTFNPFATPEVGGGGLSFSLAPGPVTGQGQVEPTPLGARLHHLIQASAPNPLVTETTTFSQKFVFSRDDNGTEPTGVFINGILDGLLEADGGGRATALGTMELFAGDGTFIDRTERLAFADSNSSNGSFVRRDVDERFGLFEVLIPGNTYELRTLLELTADPRSSGLALADFSNTFEVELSGVAPIIPEPSTLMLSTFGLLGMGWRRRKRT